MRVEQFVADRIDVWQELESMVARSGNRPERLGAASVRRMGEHYRSVAGDLAFARRGFPGDPVVARLEALVLRARPAVYARRERPGVWGFVCHGYWRSVRERPGALLLAACLLFAPAFLAGAWAWQSPDAASGLVPVDFQSITEPRAAGQDLGLAVDEQARFSAEIMTNNIRVTLLAFGGGLLLGFGTALVLLQNGVMLGAVTGLAINAGNAKPFFELVTAHGVLELSCIVVAGAAGLRLGGALLSPGHELRSVVLRREARRTIGVVVGTAAWLVVAGLIEGFVTPAGLGWSTVLPIGLAFGGLYWGLVMVLGRATNAPDA